MTPHQSSLMTAFLALVSSLLVGCDSFRSGSVGYANSPLTGRHHAVIRVRDAFGKDGVLWDFHGQARIGSDAQMVGVGAGMLRLFGSENAPIFPHVATGFTAIEIGQMDQVFVAGIVSPYVEFGIDWLWDPKEERRSVSKIWGGTCLPQSYWYATSGYGLSLTGAAQYDIRVTEQPNDITWRVSLGITRVTRHGPTQRMPTPSQCRSKE